MKRFWKDASVAPRESGWTIELDGRPVRTPARNELRLDSDALAEAIAREWSEAGETVEPRLSHSVAMLDPFRLAALAPMVTVGGSLIAALAVVEAAIGPEEAWQAVSLDERWQLEKWGSDAEAEAALETRRQDFLAAARFLALLG